MPRVKHYGCSVEGCEGSHYAKTLCRNCYNRKRLRGTTVYLSALPPKICATDDCTKTAKSRGMCKACYNKVWYSEHYGSGQGVWTAETVNYAGAHYRLRVVRGSASDYTCSCGEQAQGWALSAEADNLLFGPAATGRETLTAYSLDPYSYLAMCDKCHRAYDTEHANRNYKLQASRWDA